MVDYRIYLLEPSGDFRNVRVVICLDDDEAIETARLLLAECAASKSGRDAGAGLPRVPARDR
jgi:hypothetical protein